MTVIDVLIRGVRQQAQQAINLATTPTGPFTAFDRMVTTARSTFRDAGAEVGLRAPGFRGSRLRGQLGTRVETLRGKLPRLRRY